MQGRVGRILFLDGCAIDIKFLSISCRYPGQGKGANRYNQKQREGILLAGEK
jgi:hypothetical protein